MIGRAHGKEPLSPALSVALRDAPTAGMECWSEGQKHKMSMRPDWDAVKVDIMYRYAGGVHLSLSPLRRIPSAKSPPPHYNACRVNVAKYVANPALQADLLSTGREVIDGAASTGWTSAGATNSQLQYRNSVMIVAGRSCAQLELVEWSDTGLFREGAGGLRVACALACDCAARW